MNGRAIAVLAASWIVLEGRLGMREVVLAVVVAVSSLAVSGDWAWRAKGPLRVGAFLEVGWVFVSETVVGTYQVGRLVVSPGMRFRPAVIEVPLRVRRDSTIALFAGMVAVIPGTLVLGIARDRTRMYVHVLDARNLDDVRRSLARIEDAVHGALP
ncbi:MAG TPA: Na+/H+ antiporter subunit E [Polyangiaceae bacterium]|nr:Na+/H+ antiporter subunit E [Polyangiaceae bacterium]